MRENKNGRRPLVGASSIIVIFAVLCLAVFAVLVLTSENSARRMSQVSAEAVQAYYEADAKAEQTVAQIKSGEIPDHVSVEDGIYSFSEKISDTLCLYVELELREGEWTVLRWQSVSSVR